MTEATAQFNFRDVERIMRDLDTKASARLNVAGLVAAGRVIRNKARTPNYRFRDRSGRLRRSIKVRRARGRARGRGNRGTPFAQIVIGGPGARQGFLIEVGSKFAKGRTPLRSAQEETSSQQLAEMRTKMAAELRKYAGESRRGNVRRAPRSSIV